MVKDITVGSGSTIIDDMTVYNGKLYFTAYNVTDFDSNLWVTDGTAVGTVKIPINLTGDSDVSNLLVYNFDFVLLCRTRFSGEFAPSTRQSKRPDECAVL